MASINDDILDHTIEAVKLRKNPVKITFKNIKYEVDLPATTEQF